MHINRQLTQMISCFLINYTILALRLDPSISNIVFFSAEGNTFPKQKNVSGIIDQVTFPPPHTPDFEVKTNPTDYNVENIPIL